MFSWLKRYRKPKRLSSEPSQSLPETRPSPAKIGSQNSSPAPPLPLPDTKPPLARPATQNLSSGFFSLPPPHIRPSPSGPRLPLPDTQPSSANLDQDSPSGSSLPSAPTHFSPVKLVTQAFHAQKPFQFLALPFEIRMQIYALLLCPKSTIDLLYKRDFLDGWDYLNGLGSRSTTLGGQERSIDPNILRSNRQIHSEASDVLYSQAVLHLRCDPSLCLPFPEWPLRGFEKPMRCPNDERDKISPEVFRRFKKIKLTVYIVSLRDTELKFRGNNYDRSSEPYTPRDIRAGMRGLKDVLEVLAVAETRDSSNGTPIEDPKDLKLYIDLRWPPASSTGVSVASSYTPNPSWTTPRRARTSLRPSTMNKFKDDWRKEGVWHLLGQVAKIRTIDFCKSALREYGPIWADDLARQLQCGRWNVEEFFD